jgi:hypothetical protein
MKQLRDEQSPYTIEEFCQLEAIGRTTYFALKARGLGPKEDRIIGMNYCRITPQARREWRAMFDEYQKKNAGKIEAARRRKAEKLSLAGHKSVAVRRKKARRPSPKRTSYI